MTNQRWVTRKEFERMRSELQAQLAPVQKLILDLWMLLPTPCIVVPSDIHRFEYAKPKIPPDVQFRIDRLDKIVQDIIEASGINEVRIIDQHDRTP